MTNAMTDDEMMMMETFNSLSPELQEKAIDFLTTLVNNRNTQPGQAPANSDTF